MSARSRALGASLLLLLAVGASAPDAHAQAAPDSARLALAARIMRAAKVTETMVAAITAGIPSQKAAMPNIPAEFWEAFESKARGSVDSLTHLMAPVYAETFSREELQGLLAFYESPLGQRMVAAQPQILARSMEIGRQWGARMGQELITEILARKKAGD
jgi:hypothetical protein